VPPRKVIAVALPLLSEGEIAQVDGIRKGLDDKGYTGEVLVLGGGYETPLRHLAEQDKLAGAIGDFMGPAWLESLRRQGIALVQLGQPEQWGPVGIATVSIDLEAMAEEALDSLRAGKASSAAYLGPSGPSGSARLGAVFQTKAEAAGMAFRMIQETSGLIFGNTLRELTLPAGVLCFSDHLARLLIQTGLSIGLHAPRDLAVIGVGNSTLESLQAGIEISSFETPHWEIGRQAGRLMAGLLTGRREESIIRVIPRFHLRESSLVMKSGIDRMMAYLRGNPETEANAADLARIAGMSRRSLEKGLRASQNETPGGLLRRLRQERAEKLLRTTDLTISRVASECGYREPALFSTAFRRWTGVSPRDFRKNFLIRSSLNP